jgi:hypothetical protein
MTSLQPAQEGTTAREGMSRISAEAQSRGSSPTPRRLLWIVNHRTLMFSEVPILRSLGWEVFVSKIIPNHDPEFRSPGVTFDYDSALTLPAATLRVLNRHNFYERTWSPTVEDIVNRHFDVIVIHFSYYTTSLSEAARKFHGRVIVRAFGREHPKTYSEFADIGPHKDLIRELEALGDRFVFGQGYGNLAEVEPPEIARRAHTITAALPPHFSRYHNTWRGDGGTAIFLCPAIRGSTFYGEIYQRIKGHFGDLPHAIFGKQIVPMDDPSVLPYMTDAELFELYAAAPVFVYPHAEPRHIHYSPLEAIVVGTPTLYLRGMLIDKLTNGAELPGGCRDITEMRNKTQRLLSGDRGLAEEIRASQGVILNAFAPELARRQWAAVLPGSAMPIAAEYPL